MSTQAFAERFRHFAIKETPWFHRLWYDAFDDPNLNRLYVMGPREHAKTSCVLTYVMKRLAEDQSLRVGIVSGGDDLAKKFLMEIKHEFESNTELEQVYGRLPGPKWNAHELVMRNARRLGLRGKDVSLFSIGRGGQISSRHCDILVVDDVENADSVKSDLVRQSTREWWSREVLPVLSPGGKFIVVGTRKHFDDLYSYLTPEGGWTLLDAAKSVWKDNGDPIWPEMWNREALLVRKNELDAQDLLAWPQEYLNTPLPSETQMFYPEKWPKFGSPPKELTIYQFWDLAISEKTTADYTVGWTIGVDDSSNVYLLERRRGHWDFNTTLSQIASMGAAWPTVATVGIEQVSYQAAAVQEALRRTMLPIIPVVPDKDKVTRARILEARAAALKVHRPVEVDWWVSFATEATYFPLSPHDDQIDALAGAIRLAGWEATTTAWMYGVWTCTNCKHMFLFEAFRPCPKCGTKAPAEFENPELLSYGSRFNPGETLEVPVHADGTPNLG